MLSGRNTLDGLVEKIFQIIVPGVIGALTSGLPLYIMLRKSNREITENDKISVEAEWKRILQFRSEELIRLTAKDTEQEDQIKGLQLQHMECEKKEARHAERIIINEERIRYLEITIIELKAEVLSYKKGRRRNGPVPNDSGPDGPPDASGPGSGQQTE